MTKRDYFAVWKLALVMTLAVLLYVDRAMAESVVIGGGVMGMQSSGQEVKPGQCGMPSIEQNASVVVEVASKLKQGQWVKLDEITPADVRAKWNRHFYRLRAGNWAILNQLFAEIPPMPVDDHQYMLYRYNPELAGYLEYKHGYYAPINEYLIRDLSVRTNLTLNGTIIIGELRNIRNNSTNAFQIAIPAGAKEKIRVVFPRSQTADKSDWRLAKTEHKNNHIIHGMPVGERMPVQLHDKRIYRQCSLKVKDGKILNAKDCAGFGNLPAVLQGYLNAYREIGERPDVTAEMREYALSDLYADNPTLVKSIPPFSHHPDPNHAAFCATTIKSIETAMTQQKGDTVVVPADVEVKKLYENCGGMVGYWEGNSGIAHLSGNTFTRKPIARTANIVTEGKMLVGKTENGEWHLIGIKKDGTVLGGDKKLAIVYDTFVVDGVALLSENSEQFAEKWSSYLNKRPNGTLIDFMVGERELINNHTMESYAKQPLNRGGYGFLPIQGYLYAITGTGKQLDEMMASGKIIEFVTPTTINWSDLKSVKN